MFNQFMYNSPSLTNPIDSSEIGCSLKQDRSTTRAVKNSRASSIDKIIRIFWHINVDRLIVSTPKTYLLVIQ